MPHAYNDLREANLLGALALAVTDRMQHAVTRATGLGPSAAAALVTLDSPAGSTSLDGLAARLSLSHSGTVRLVDRLVRDRLAERTPGSDQRSVKLALTPLGRRTVRQVREARDAACREFLDLLTDDQRKISTAVQQVVLREIAELPADTGWVCRLCDRQACRHARDGCPLEEGARRRRRRVSSTKE
jgi:MarR family transcriptional regulator, negative regulator of the multidrug operon emrRAB